MRNKTTFLKTLLVAFGLCVGVNGAWADIVVYDFAAAYTAGEELTRSESGHDGYCDNVGWTNGKATGTMYYITNNSVNLPINSKMDYYWYDAKLVEGGIKPNKASRPYSLNGLTVGQKVIVEYTGGNVTYGYCAYYSRGVKGKIDGEVLAQNAVIPSGKAYVVTNVSTNFGVLWLIPESSAIISKITIKDIETIGAPIINAVKSLDGTKHTVSFTPASATGSEGTTASIYYTLNGDTPTQTESATCFKYDGTPFDVDYDCTVKAAAFLDDYSTSSSVVSQSLVVGVIKSATNSYTVNSTDSYNLFTQIQCQDIMLALWGNASRSVTDYYFKYTDGDWTSYELSGGDTETYSCAVTKYTTDAPTAADISGADAPSEGEIAKVTVTVSDSWTTKNSSYGSKPLEVGGKLSYVLDGKRPTAGAFLKITPTKSGLFNIMMDRFNKITTYVWESGDTYYAQDNVGTSYGHKLFSAYLEKDKTYYLYNYNGNNPEWYQVAFSSFEFIPEVSKTITAAGWATYCSPYALDLENATNLTDAYIVTGGATGVLSKTSVKDGTVPANTGLLLKGTEGSAVNVTIPIVASSSTDVSANKLEGKTASYELAANGGYVLMGTPSLGFYKNTNAFTVGANTAYLPANFDGAGARSFFSLDDEPTGIELINNSTEAINNREYYNLNGQRVTSPSKGLYIVNGKKVVIK